MSLKGQVKRVGHYKIKVCQVCGKELTKAQQKYCSTHAELTHWRRSPWSQGLSDKQLLHWHGLGTL